jgi:hypothetical protein
MKPEWWDEPGERKLVIRDDDEYDKYNDDDEAKQK